MKHLWLILFVIPLLGQTSYKCQYDGNELQNTFQSKYEGIKKAYLFKSALCNHQYWIAEESLSNKIDNNGFDYNSPINKALDNLPSLIEGLEKADYDVSRMNDAIKLEQSQRLLDKANSLTDEDIEKIHSKNRQEILENMTREERMAKH